MSENGQPTSAATGFDSAVDCERAFYQAFASRDIEGMARVWGDEGISCIHPGAGLLKGRDAVLQSWTQILAAASAPSVRVHILSRIGADELAVHLVQEHISSAGAEEASIVLATNVFRREERGWRMLSHHASVPAAKPRTGREGASLH